MAKYLIARAKVLDENGVEIPVDVRTCAEAVTCNEGKTAQEHFKTLADHIADTVAHPSAIRQAAWDAKETAEGAQSKADDAYTKAVARAQTLLKLSSSDILSKASSDATAKANNAKNDAILTAAADATAKINGFASGKSFVTSHGTVSGWRYRKWSNGTIEAWLTKSFNVSLYRSFPLESSINLAGLFSGEIESQSIPVAIGFNAVTATQITGVAVTGGVWIAPQRTTNKLTKTPPINVLSINGQAESFVDTVEISYYIIGS